MFVADVFKLIKERRDFVLRSRNRIYQSVISPIALAIKWDLILNQTKRRVEKRL